MKKEKVVKLIGRCKLCGKKIAKVGSEHWEHVGVNQHHTAEIDKSMFSKKDVGGDLWA